MHCNTPTGSFSLAQPAAATHAPARDDVPADGDVDALDALEDLDEAENVLD